MEANAQNMEMDDDMLITYLLGEASAEQAVRVEQWLTQDVANRLRLQQFSTIWETSKTMQFAEPLDAQASLLSLKQKAIERQTQQARVVRMKRNYAWLSAAAAFLLICTAGLLFFVRFANRQMEVSTVETITTDTLSDGSVITLNKRSQLNYPATFTGNERRVVLQHGEAFFKISPNKAKPFIISTNNTTIRVVGTSFNVKNKNGNVEVIVETGVVQVSRNGNMVTLKPGERVLAKTNAPLAKEQNPDQLYNYYRSKEFIADNTPLRRVVEVLNEAYAAHIIVSRKELNSLLLNTTFKDESLDDILQVISHTFKISVEKKGNQIILK
ncbi:FecR domain-containing protein [Mucilaginibacter agri]|uniref:DUF4974 domain-containing protein n=1 Tax=Mucilaginibacter agri TaxID=2695265 RepID=A0A965ZHH7_9SPHI|nr:FecR domain-containing protein [Mucilaginibacter agri]NCD71179.1 DUF4974 domain-containing protein [Mucilaginibacter agri]